MPPLKGAGPVDAHAPIRPRNERLPGSLVSKPTTKLNRPQHGRTGTAKRPDRNAEARLQASIVEWVRAVAPELICYHCPNGGYRTKAEAARLKWQGVLPGVPDLAVVGRHGQLWFLEVKADGGYLSPEQRAFAGRCTSLGVPFAEVRSIEDARQAFAAWGIPTREAGR